jgi:hypothetical protein
MHNGSTSKQGMLLSREVGNKSGFARTFASSALGQSKDLKWESERCSRI